MHDSNKSEFRNPIVPPGPGGVPHPGLVEECEWCGFMKGAPRSIAVEEPSEKNSQVGAIAASAASVLMKCLYAARMARFDLLRPVQGLAKYLTKWTKRQDDELFQLMCYINTTKSFKLVGWIGDEFHDLQAQMFSDADFAGCEATMRSTTGLHTRLVGCKSNFPISGQSKRRMH